LIVWDYRIFVQLIANYT